MTMAIPGATINLDMAKRTKDIMGGATSERLRGAIRRSGLSQNEIGRRAGIDPGIVNRFLHGTRGLTLATAEKVAAALGLKLTLTPKRKGKR